MAGTFDADVLLGILPRIPAAMAILAPDGTVMGATTAAAAVAKVEPDVMFQGLHIAEIAPGTGPLIARTVAEIAVTGECVDDQYVPWQTEDGVTELWRHTYFPLLSGDGSIASVGVLVEEVGEHERVRSRLRSFEALVDQASDFVSVAALDRRVLYLNPAGRALVGHSASDPLLEFSSDYLAPESQHLLPRDGSPPIGEPWRGRLILRHVVTGEPIPVEATVFVVRDDTAQPLFYGTVIRDTRNHDRLVRRLELQIERMPVALITVGSGGDIRAWNPAAAAMFGHSAAEAVGQRVHELLGSPQLRAIVASGGVTNHVVAVTTAGGETVTAEWSAVAIEPADGDPAGVMLIGRDMSVQLRAELERREALRAAAMATWTADLWKGEMTWSDELYDLVGVNPREFVPSLRSCWALLDPSERARARRLRRRMATNPQFRFTFPITRPADGMTRYMEVEGRRVGHHGRLIGTARDVTTQRRAANRLRELDRQRGQLLERMLLSEEEERGRIARALHDDTVQLMAALQLNLDRIQNVLGGEPPAATTLVSETRSALSAALERTRHLMFELRPQRFDRHGLRVAITALCEQVGQEAGFQVSVDVPEQRMDGVVEELCYRTVREAVVNARKHSEASHLWVRLRPGEGSITGVVVDDGRGFDVRQLDPSHLRLHMGLEAMAERIRLAGGSCDVASAPGEGCTVSFTIPVVSDAVPWDGVV